MANLPYNARSLIWIADSLDELSAFPTETKRVMGFALRLVQNGETPAIAKPLSGYGSGVWELKASGENNTYRVVYVLKLKKGVYVIDAFVKKSKRGRQVPREIAARIKERLAYARKLDEEGGT